MRSGTSCFNITVWKKIFLRFWPIWTANLACWLLCLPVRGLMAMKNDGMAEFSYTVGSAAPEFGLFCALVLGPIAAMAAFSHLYSARAANFTGALPVRREGLFVSHYLAGLSMLLLPNLAVFLLTLPVEAAGGVVCMPSLLFWLGCLCAEEFFFYCFAVCLGMFAGHILALPVFYGIFNCIAAAMYMTLEWIFRRFIYGWAPPVGSFADDVVVWLTPVWKLLRNIRCTQRIRYGDFAREVEIQGGGILLAYTAAAVVLTVCALLLYRRRQLETAGDVVAVKAMRPVFRYGVAACAGLFFGYLTYLVLGLGTFGFAAAIFLWAVAGCFIAQMILDKSFRVFHKWKGSAAVAAAFLLLFAVIAFDWTGYEKRVPDPAQVDYVEVGRLLTEPSDGAGYFHYVRVDDPETIKLVTELHRAAAELRDGHLYTGLSMRYYLANGSTLCRDYDFVGMERAGDELSQMVLALANDPALLRQAYNIDRAEECLSKGGRIVEVGIGLPDGRYNAFTNYGSMFSDTEREAYFSGGDARTLWDAVLTDLDAGNIKRYFPSDMDELPRYLRLSFTLESGDIPNEDTVYIDSMYTDTEAVNVTILLPDTAQNAVAVLEEMGVLRK